MSGPSAHRATWIEGRDIKKLETEGHQLKSLLGGADDRASADTEPNNPSRYSVAAMIGAVLSVFFVAATVICAVVVTQNRVWLVQPIDWSPLLICVLVVGVAGAATTLVGGASISAVRASKGKIIGLGLAFTVAILFPLLLIDVIICGLLFVVSTGLFPDSSFPEPLFIALMPMLWFLADALLIHYAWTTVSKASEETGNAKHASDHVG